MLMLNGYGTMATRWCFVVLPGFLMDLNDAHPTMTHRSEWGRFFRRKPFGFSSEHVNIDSREIQHTRVRVDILKPISEQNFLICRMTWLFIGESDGMKVRQKNLDGMTKGGDYFSISTVPSLSKLSDHF